MISPSSYRDEPFSWVMASNSEENVPLLRGEGAPLPSYDESQIDHSSVNEEQYEEPANPNGARNYNGSGSTVQCRVCDAVIELEGRDGQHVVKCQQCNEATPIRTAPPGKKYVRCPCNCLLICKAASTRIACPRNNCRRVITLGQTAMTGTAVPAPTGTCRVLCAHCADVFMFNTLMNCLASCPHCRKKSSVGVSYARTRCVGYTVATLVVLSLFLLVTILISTSSMVWTALYFVDVALFGITFYLLYKTIYFWRVKVSTIVQPL